MFKHKHSMGFKTLTIKEEVYEKLLKAKGKEESFSDFFEKTISREKPDLMRFYGAWKMSKKEAESVKKTIKEYREAADKRFHERVKKAFE